MSDFSPFIVAGLVAGSIYGLTAVGLVLTYRTSGIFNFSHGALAAAGAYLFYQVRTEWGWPWPIALVISVAIGGPLAGLGLELLARPLARASTASKVVATVGLLTAVQGVLTAIYGASTRNFPGWLPTRVYRIASVNVGADQLLVFAIAVTLTVALTQFLRRSRTGTAMRGVVDNAELLDLAGTSPVAIRRMAWMIGTSFAALSGVLLAPIVGLDPLNLTLLVVQAFGAAAVGRFTSLPLAFGGGLLVGVAAALSSKYVNDVPSLSGLPPSLPFIVLFVVLVLTRRGRLVELGTVGFARATVARERAPWRRAALAVGMVALVLWVPTLAGTRLPVFTTATIYVLIFASLRLLVVTSGQVSLCHIAFAAVGATSFAHLQNGLGLPWLVALVVAGLVTVPVGAFVAIPAIRLSGLYLALATFGFGVLVERFVYGLGLMFGGDGEAIVSRPDLVLFDATTDRGYYYLTAAIVAMGVGVVHLVGRSRLGRLLRAMSGSPLALVTLGAGVNVTRVLVFSISAALAGIAGALYAGFSGLTTGASFISFTSLTLIVVLAISGPGELQAPIAAAVALQLVPSYLNDESFTELLPVLFGVSAVTVSILSAPRPPGAGGFLARGRAVRARVGRVQLRARRAVAA